MYRKIITEKLQDWLGITEQLDSHWTRIVELEDRLLKDKKVIGELLDRVKVLECEKENHELVLVALKNHFGINFETEYVPDPHYIEPMKPTVRTFKVVKRGRK